MGRRGTTSGAGGRSPGASSSSASSSPSKSSPSKSSPSKSSPSKSSSSSSTGGRSPGKTSPSSSRTSSPSKSTSKSSPSKSSSSSSTGGRSPGKTSPSSSKTSSRRSTPAVSSKPTPQPNTKDAPVISSDTKTQYTVEIGKETPKAEPVAPTVSPIISGYSNTPLGISSSNNSKNTLYTPPKIQERSYVGYDDYSRPLQGAPRSDYPSQYAVDIGRTQTVILPTMGGGSYEAQAKDPLVFDSKEEAQAFINTSQNVSTQTPGKQKDGSKWMVPAYKYLDESSAWLQSDQGLYGNLYRSTQAGSLVGVGKMALGVGIGLDNLATQTIAPYLSNQGVTSYYNKPKLLEQSSESGDQVVFPYNFEESRFKTGGEITQSSAAYIKKYGLYDYIGSIASGYYVTPKAFVTLASKMGIGSSKIVMQTTAQTVTGAPVKEAVQVATEYKLFGKPIISKVYENPTTVNVVKKGQQIVDTKMVDNTGSYSLGKTKTGDVLAKTDLNPQGRGLEIITGTKTQTRFNKEIVNELVKEGKMNQGDVKFIKDIERGVKLAREEKPIIYSGFGEKPLKYIPSGGMTQSIMKGLNIAQSPINFIKLRTRLGQVGGSMGQDTQLKPWWQKGAKHDIDIDTPKTKDAIRHNKTIYDEVLQHSTDDVKIEMASNKKKITVTSKETGGKPDEFIEFLDEKDAVKYQSVAQSSGLRFNEKYRTDKLSKILHQPLKDADYSIKVRDIRDQILAKASSVISIQGRSTEKFKGTVEIGSWEAKQNRLIDEGVLHVDPPSLRGKDTVDLYKIFKSRAEELSESSNTSKQNKGKELDEIAESIKERSPELDYSQKAGDTVSEIVSESSASSLAADMIKPYGNVTPIVVKPSVQQIKSNEYPNFSPRSMIVSRTISSKTLTSVTSISKSIYSKYPSIRSTSTSPTSTSPTSTSAISVKPHSATHLTPIIKSPTMSRSTLSKIEGNANTSINSFRPYPVMIRDGSNVPQKRRISRRNRKDFLGNTRTDNIVGLFRRTEIITGDKKTAKQLAKDKKYKEGKKRKRTKPKKKSFLQKQGILTKGFKI